MDRPEREGNDRCVTNSEICRLFADDAPRGMDMLFFSYYKPLVLWADTIVRNLPRAEDIVQDFFVSIWEREIYRNLRPETLSAFLFTSVRNRCLNRIEKKDIFNRLADFREAEQLFEEFIGGDDGGELETRIREEISALSPRSREIIHGVFVEKKKYREVAEQLEISVSNVKTVVARSIGKIRQRLTILCGFWF